MIFNRRFYVVSVSLALCAILETYALTFMQGYGAEYYYSSSIIYFLSGIGVCLLPLLAVGQGRSIREPGTLPKVIPIFFILFFVALLASHLCVLIPLYRSQPIDKRWADMIPSIQLACQRLLHGSPVYGPAPEIRTGALIPYLPMMWIPFLPAEIFEFDYRWITFSAQMLGILLTLWPLLRHGRGLPLVPSLLSGAGLFLLVHFFLQTRQDYWALTQEGVVTFFYLLLGFALLRQNFILIGLAMMACTLSRYSLLFWVPVYLVYVFVTASRRNFWTLFISYSVSMLVIFVLPFFVREPTYFINIPMQYMEGQLRFWRWTGLDLHLYFNVGFYKFFNIAQLRAMLVWQVSTSFLAPLLLLLFGLWAQRKYQFNSRYITFASFKISILCFYAFIQMPYLYIFVPATIISYVVLFDYLGNGNTKIFIPDHES